MDEVSSIVELIKNAGPIGGGVLFGYALHKGWIVLGREYGDCIKSRDAYKALLDTHAAKLEDRLDRYEADRDKQHVTTR